MKLLPPLLSLVTVALLTLGVATSWAGEFERAMAAYEARDYGKAKSVIDEAAAKWPDNASLANARGLAQLGLGDVPGAIASFRQATEREPKASNPSTTARSLAGRYALRGRQTMSMIATVGAKK